MNTSELIIALSKLGNMTCKCCHRQLIEDDAMSTVIRKHLIISNKKEGIITIECRHCRHKNIVASSN